MNSVIQNNLKFMQQSALQIEPRLVSSLEQCLTLDFRPQCIHQVTESIKIELVFKHSAEHKHSE